MRLILRGDKLSAKKYIGFAKARLNDMKNIMGALGLNYNKKYYKLPDAELVVESRYGLDSAWINGLVVVVGCEIDFTADVMSGSNPLTVQFTVTNSCDFDTWLWDFGNGHFSIQKDPSHVFLNAGVFSVKLKGWVGASYDVLGLATSDEYRKREPNHSAFLAAPWVFEGSFGTPVPGYFFDSLSRYQARRILFSYNLASYDVTSEIRITVSRLGGLELASGVSLAIDSIKQGSLSRQNSDPLVYEAVLDLTPWAGDISVDLETIEINDYPDYGPSPLNTVWMAGIIESRKYSFSSITSKIKTDYITVT